MRRGSSLTTIDMWAFSGSGLTSIEIPASVPSIEGYAFYRCANLESVTFEEGSKLTTIGNSSFSNCTALTGIDIPSGVTKIEQGAFLCVIIWRA